MYTVLIREIQILQTFSKNRSVLFLHVIMSETEI